MPRSESIEITAWDREGNPVTAQFSGFTARIFQHEVDHLNGIRFPDRIGEGGKLHWIEEDEYPQYREKWETWDRCCPWQIWLDMKEGRAYVPPCL